MFFWRSAKKSIHCWKVFLRKSLQICSLCSHFRKYAEVCFTTIRLSNLIPVRLEINTTLLFPKQMKISTVWMRLFWRENASITFSCNTWEKEREISQKNQEKSLWCFCLSKLFLPQFYSQIVWKFDGYAASQICKFDITWNWILYTFIKRFFFVTGKYFVLKDFFVLFRMNGNERLSRYCWK